MEKKKEATKFNPNRKTHWNRVCVYTWLKTKEDYGYASGIDIAARWFWHFTSTTRTSLGEELSCSVGKSIYL